MKKKLVKTLALALALSMIPVMAYGASSSPKNDDDDSSSSESVYEDKTVGGVLWSSIFVTLVAKKYHESVTLPSGLRMVYDNH